MFLPFAEGVPDQVADGLDPIVVLESGQNFSGNTFIKGNMKSFDGRVFCSSRRIQYRRIHARAAESLWNINHQQGGQKESWQKSFCSYGRFLSGRISSRTVKAGDKRTPKELGKSGIKAIVKIDKASKGNPQKAGARGCLLLPEENKVVIFSKRLVDSSNNMAELKAALLRLDIVKDLGIRKVLIQEDSSLVINQPTRNWNQISWTLEDMHFKIQRSIKNLDLVLFHHIPQKLNRLADYCANVGVRLTLGVKFWHVFKLNLKGEVDLCDVAGNHSLGWWNPSPMAFMGLAPSPTSLNLLQDGGPSSYCGKQNIHQLVSEIASGTNDRLVALEEVLLHLKEEGAIQSSAKSSLKDGEGSPQPATVVESEGR
eukprot:Gb_29470 [translate_table: standard]